MPYIVIGLLVTAVGIWLLTAPRHSKVGVFLGPMILFRLLGALFVILGLLTFLAGTGLPAIGPFPITLK